MPPFLPRSEGSSPAMIPTQAGGGVGNRACRPLGTRGISCAWLGVSDGSFQKNVCSSNPSLRDWQGAAGSPDSRPGDTPGASEEAPQAVRCLLGMFPSSIQSRPQCF